MNAEWGKKKILEQLNPWWEEKSYTIPVHKRQRYLDPLLKSTWVDVLVGTRRSGKTSIISILIEGGVNGQSILYYTAEASPVEVSVREVVEEVKYRSEISEDDFLAYSNHTGVTLVVSPESSISKSIAAYPEITIHRLDEILLQ